MSPRLLLAIPLAMLAMPANSAVQRAPAAEPMAELGRCRAIADSATRLACYDRAAGKLTQAIADKQVVVLDSNEVRKTRRGLFGFSLPQLPFFGKDGEDSPEAREISARLASVSQLGYGKWRVRLDDGAVWETTEASDAINPAAGQNVVIRKASLGSYFLRFGSSRGVRAKRVS